MEALDAIFTRRSIGRLTDPAPSGDDLRRILEAAVVAPDHDLLRPWRFFVLQGAAKDAFGQVLRDAYLARVASAGGEPTEGQLEKERTKLGRAPLVIVVAAVHVHSDKIPFAEQMSSAAAAVQNLLLAATALGYGSMWRTGDVAYDPRIKRTLGLSEHDAIVGYVYLGTPHQGGDKPANVADLTGVVHEWTAPIGAG